MGEDRGSIAFFSSYRPPVPLDIFSRHVPSTHHEERMTDGEFYNYNGQVIPPEALKVFLKRPKLASHGTAADVDSGHLSGMIFISERESSRSLETLHIALQFHGHRHHERARIFNFADVFGTYNGVRMEDNGCVAGKYLVYVSTMEPAPRRRQPWTAVFKTNLITGKTDRLTPPGQADLSPSVSPSGKKVAVASFENKGGWKGEIEDLQTSIYVMDIENPLENRKLVVENGGWPSWGSEDVIFFHRKVGSFWGVFRADLRGGCFPIEDTPRVTPDGIDAVTPAAIDATTVAVATIRKKSEITGHPVEREAAQYRHIEIFDSRGRKEPVQITRTTRPKTDHFNPFVIDAGKRIGYHRCHINDNLQNGGDIERQFQKLGSPHEDVEVIRVPGVFPTFSNDGSKLAFVDNEFKTVWVADDQGLRVVYSASGPDKVFSPVWNKNPKMDTLYLCVGPSFQPRQELNIHAITDLSGANNDHQLTNGFNNAFPSTSPDGSKLVFRSTRDGGANMYKSLYIMEDARCGESGGKITRLTFGDYIDTHCHWSPSGDWIVFASDRGKPLDAPEKDNNLDPGYFSVHMVKWNDPTVVIRVMGSADDLSGHVNHPFFSPDGRTLVVTSDLAGVTVDPMSLPLFMHSVRPYGDIFTFDIDQFDINKNKDLKEFTRVTHSRYENSTATWTRFSTHDPHAKWSLLLDDDHTPHCPFLHGDGHESWHMTGHLLIPKNCG